jgi:uncharacterized membrane protein
MYQAYQPPPMPMRIPVSRVPRHLQTLGILWCVFGAYRLFAGLSAVFFVRLAAMGRFGGSEWPFGHSGPFGPHWMGAFMPIIFTFIIALAVLALLVGYGLLVRKPWGRTLAIIVAILSLMRIPFGTALGIYTLWVLAPSESGAEYDAIADPS